MKYLLDINVLSEAVKSNPSQSVLAKLAQYHDEIVTAAPVWHELQYGCQRLPPSRKRDLIANYLSRVIEPNVTILPYDERAAAWHAGERARLVAAGKTPSFVDGQIAAIAKTSNLILVTRNTADFMLFTELAIENWHLP